MKIWKRVLSTVLASALVLGLGGCSKEGGGIGIGIGGKDDNKTASANSSLAKEYVYRMDEFDFSAVQNEGAVDCSVVKIAQADEKIYIILSAYDEMGNNAYKLLTMNNDGSDMEMKALQMGMDQDEATQGEAAQESDGNSEENAPNDAVTPIQPRTETTVEVEESLESEDAGIDMDMSLDEEDYESYTWENTGFGTFLFADGCIYANKTYYYEDYSDPENYVSIRDNYVCCWDLEGNMVWETPVEILSDENKWYYVNSIALLAHNKVALLISGDENGKIVVDAEGNVSDLQPVEKLEEYFANPAYTAMTMDGKLLVTYYDNEWTNLYVATYDFANDVLTASYPLPTFMTYSGLSNLCVDENGDLIYANNQGLSKYHIGDTEPTQMMSYVNSDMSVSYMDAFLYLDAEHFIGIYSEYDDVTYKRTLEGGLFTKVNPEDIPDKEVLVLGGNYISGDIKKRVVNYNKSSQTHRIVLKDYSQYITGEDYMAGYTQLNNDIIAGNMPDIIVVDSYNMSLENYVSKGLLADIGELITKDEELSKVEFMDNVFEACSIDGKLYEIVPAFNVSTYVGKTSFIGERTGWTMEDAQAVLAKMPEGASLFGDMTRAGYFNTVIEMCGRDFVDVSTGKCSFDSEEFVSLMEFAKTLPEEMGDDYYNHNWYQQYETQYREDRTLLADCYISSFENMVYTINGSFGEDVSFVGMPTSSGQGSIIYATSTYALSSQSSQLEEAWNFMRYYLTDEYQSTLSWQLPIVKSRFDELAQEATKKPVYEDENGKEVESDYTYWMNDEEIILDPLTQEQVKEITDFIASVNTRAYYNNDINNIITEEMGAFYQDQKSAKDVAGIIQSRAQLFVNENR